MNPAPSTPAERRESVIPWTRGFLAQRQGVSLADNPHPPDDPACRSWRLGWKSACDTVK